MFINKIFLENFRSHKKTEIKLGNMTFLIGRNGSGKSSITDALCILLAGRTPEIAYKKEAFEGLIREGEDSFGIRVIYGDGEEGAAAFGRGGGLVLTGQIPEIPRASVLYMMDPAQFFKQNRSEREKLICSIVGLDFGVLTDKVKKKATSMGLSAILHFSSMEDVHGYLRRLDADLAVVRKEAKQFEFFKSPPAKESETKVDTNEMQRLLDTITQYDQMVEKLNGWKPGRKPVIHMKGDLAILNETLETERLKNQQIRSSIHEASLKISACTRGKCPLDMGCPFSKKEFMAQAGAFEKELEKQNNLLLESNLEVDRIADEADNLYKEIQKAEDFAYANAKKEEVEAARKRYNELLMKDTDDYSTNHKRYLQAAESVERLEQFKEFLLESLRDFSLEQRFNKIMPPTIHYKDDVVYWNGRQYSHLSHSQRYRCQCAVAQAVARGMKLLVLDEFQMLDPNGKAEMIKFLQSAVVKDAQIIILSAHTSSEKITMTSKFPAIQGYYLNLVDGVTEVAEL